MQFMQTIKAIVKPRSGVIATLVMVGVVASVMGLAPTHGASNTLAQDCANPPSTPTFNYWPVTYDDVNTPFCHDFQAIDAALDTVNPQFSKSEQDWNDGLTMQVGEQAAAQIYLHNGAANNLDPALTTAKNVRVITRTETTAGSVHKITVTFTADNAATYTRSFNIHTPANSQLEIKPNSGYLYDYQGNPIQGGLNLGNSEYVIGDLQACFEFSMFMTFKFKVVAPNIPTNATVTLDKGVRNISRDGASDRGKTYASSVNAKHNEKVGYKIVVTNTSNQTAKNVTVTDNSVSGLSVDSGSVTVGMADDTLISSSLWQGTIPGTINLGDIPAGEQRVIKYTGDVENCDNTLVNRATVNSTNAGSTSDTATVYVDSCGTTGHSNMTIRKQVKNNTTGTSYTENVKAYNGDRVNFKVTVTNNGSTTLNNVVMTDVIPSGLRFDDSVTGDGTPSYSSRETFSVDFGTIRAGDSKTVEFAALVTANNTSTICNVAKATATGVSQVQDDACVNMDRPTNPGNSRIELSKRAFNDTKNTDAVSVSAARGDYITYSLVTTNNGNASATNYVIKDDLSQVLPLADIVSTNGGTISGNVISYPSVTIRAGETVVKTFQVRVKQSLSKNLSYQLRNTYGNQILINVPGDTIYVPPVTGAAGTSAVAFAGLVTAGFVVARKRNSIFKFIFA